MFSTLSFYCLIVLLSLKDAKKLFLLPKNRNRCPIHNRSIPYHRIAHRVRIHQRSRPGCGCDAGPVPGSRTPSRSCSWHPATSRVLQSLSDPPLPQTCQYPGGAAVFKAAVHNARIEILGGAINNTLTPHIDPPVLQIMGGDQFKGFKVEIDPFYVCAQ